MKSVLNAMILVMVVFVSIGLPIDKTTTGFYYPTGISNLTGDTKWLASGCNGNSGYFTGEYHIGHDFKTNLNAPVYAIADGEVITISYNNWGTDNVGVVVKHWLSNQSCFLAIYGHVRTNIAIGNKVYAGQSFATIGPWSSGTHLHFGIVPGSSMPPSPWGRMLCANWPSTNSFVDPINWLTTKTPCASVGLFSDGRIDQRFRDLYTQAGGAATFGKPFNNGKTAYVHYWPDLNGNPNQAGSSDALLVQDCKKGDIWSQLVLNSTVSKAYAMFNKILYFWNSNWGYRDYGPPFTNEFAISYVGNQAGVFGEQDILSPR